MNRTLCVAIVFAVMIAGAGQTQEKSVGMVPVKYDGLKQEILKHRGKVLITQFWTGG